MGGNIYRAWGAKAETRHDQLLAARLPAQSTVASASAASASAEKKLPVVFHGAATDTYMGRFQQGVRVGANGVVVRPPAVVGGPSRLAAISSRPISTPGGIGQGPRPIAPPAAVAGIERGSRPAAPPVPGAPVLKNDVRPAEAARIQRSINAALNERALALNARATTTTSAAPSSAAPLQGNGMNAMTPITTVNSGTVPRPGVSAPAYVPGFQQRSSAPQTSASVAAAQAFRQAAISSPMPSVSAAHFYVPTYGARSPMASIPMPSARPMPSSTPMPTVRVSTPSLSPASSGASRGSVGGGFSGGGLRRGL